MMLVKELTPGQDLAVELNSRELTVNAVADLLAQYEPAGRTSYSAVLKLTSIPEPTNSPNRKVRRRVYLMALAAGMPPSRYGLTAADRLPMWPEDALLAKQIRNALTGESGPGGNENGESDDPGFKKPRSSTRSNRTGPGRKSQRGRTPAHIGTPVCEPAAA